MIPSRVVRTILTANVVSLGGSLKNGKVAIPEPVLLAERAGRYGMHMHQLLLSEDSRLGFYKKIIDETVKNKTVIDLGTGSGILAMLAARAGATHVYALEKNELMYELAKKHVSQNRLQRKITVIHFRAGTRAFKQIPKVDVVVQEIFGGDPLNENVALALAQMKPFVHSRTIFLPESFTYTFRPLTPSSISKLCFEFDGLKFKGLEFISKLPLKPPMASLKEPLYQGQFYSGPTLLMDIGLQSRLTSGTIGKAIIAKSDESARNWAYSFKLNSCNHEIYANGLGRYSTSSSMWKPVFFQHLASKPNKGYITFGSLNGNRTLAW